MKLTEKCLTLKEVSAKELRTLRTEGVITRKVDGDEELYTEHVKAAVIANYERDDSATTGYYHEVYLTQIGRGDIYLSREVIDIQDEFPVIYAVTKTIANITYRAATSYYTELAEAIDEYTKVKNFLKDL